MSRVLMYTLVGISSTVCPPRCAEVTCWTVLLLVGICKAALSPSLNNQWVLCVGVDLHIPLTTSNANGRPRGPVMFPLLKKDGNCHVNVLRLLYWLQNVISIHSRSVCMVVAVLEGHCYMCMAHRIGLMPTYPRTGVQRHRRESLGPLPDPRSDREDRSRVPQSRLGVGT